MDCFSSSCIATSVSPALSSTGLALPHADSAPEENQLQAQGEGDSRPELVIESGRAAPTKEEKRVREAEAKLERGKAEEREKKETAQDFGAQTSCAFFFETAEKRISPCAQLLAGTDSLLAETTCAGEGKAGFSSDSPASEPDSFAPHPESEAFASPGVAWSHEARHRNDPNGGDVPLLRILVHAPQSLEASSFPSVDAKVISRVTQHLLKSKAPPLPALSQAPTASSSPSVPSSPLLPPSARLSPPLSSSASRPPPSRPLAPLPASSLHPSGLLFPSAASSAPVAGDVAPPSASLFAALPEARCVAEEPAVEGDGKVEGLCPLPPRDLGSPVEAESAQGMGVAVESSSPSLSAPSRRRKKDRQAREARQKKRKKSEKKNVLASLDTASSRLAQTPARYASAADATSALATEVCLFPSGQRCSARLLRGKRASWQKGTLWACLDDELEAALRASLEEALARGSYDPPASTGAWSPDAEPAREASPPQELPMEPMSSDSSSHSVEYLRERRPGGPRRLRGRAAPSPALENAADADLLQNSSQPSVAPPRDGDSACATPPLRTWKRRRGIVLVSPPPTPGLEDAAPREASVRRDDAAVREARTRSIFLSPTPSPAPARRTAAILSPCRRHGHARRFSRPLSAQAELEPSEGSTTQLGGREGAAETALRLVGDQGAGASVLQRSAARAGRGATAEREGERNSSGVSKISREEAAAAERGCRHAKASGGCGDATPGARQEDEAESEWKRRLSDRKNRLSALTTQVARKSLRARLASRGVDNPDEEELLKQQRKREEETSTGSESSGLVRRRRRPRPKPSCRFLAFSNDMRPGRRRRVLEKRSPPPETDDEGVSDFIVEDDEDDEDETEDDATEEGILADSDDEEELDTGQELARRASYERRRKRDSDKKLEENLNLDKAFERYVQFLVLSLFSPTLKFPFPRGPADRRAACIPRTRNAPKIGSDFFLTAVKKIEGLTPVMRATMETTSFPAWLKCVLKEYPLCSVRAIDRRIDEIPRSLRCVVCGRSQGTRYCVSLGGSPCDTDLLYQGELAEWLVANDLEWLGRNAFPTAEDPVLLKAREPRRKDPARDALKQEAEGMTLTRRRHRPKPGEEESPCSSCYDFPVGKHCGEQILAWHKIHHFKPRLLKFMHTVIKGFSPCVLEYPEKVSEIFDEVSDAFTRGEGAESLERRVSPLCTHQPGTPACEGEE